MSLSRYIERLEFLDNLIRRNATGNLGSLSRKLNLSKSQTVMFIKELRSLGFPIAYSRKKESYFYEENGRMVDHLFDKDDSNPDGQLNELSRSQLRKISGGQTFFNPILNADYISMNDKTFVKMK